ncbi:MAG: hypothetical protein E7289_04465 [Lachnospiraceae bacterium]|nr:hypothetical protein [Lachnospiraceae bacterium]
MKKNTISKNLLQAGMTLSDRRYRVDELLGDNGLTVSYKGYDTFRKKTVVIKELFPQQIMQRNQDQDHKVECKKLSDEELFRSMKEHMIQRAKKLIRLYPVEGIANVLTYLEERETVYVIEEYVEGQSLEELLFKRHSAKFLPEDLMQYLAPVMDTLAKIHANGMFHGAVYPDNILILKDRQVILTSCTDPMEDVAAPQLSGIAARKDAYSPVELFVPEAKRGSSTDIFEVSAILYRYVTGEPLPVYYDRVNEETVATAPTEMMTRVMEFQSEAIMKGVGVYDFERYETIQQLKEALCPADVDYESLNSDLGVARNFAKEPFAYRQQKKAKRNYFLLIGAILLVTVIVLGPGLTQVGKGIMIDHFYKKFLDEDLPGQFQMMMELSEKERSLYTNDYTNLDESLTDEEKSEQAEIKYYDFQLGKYVTHDKFDTNRSAYEYMKIDYREDEVWIRYFSPAENIQMTINLNPVEENKYEIITISVSQSGSQNEKRDYISYKK